MRNEDIPCDRIDSEPIDAWFVSAPSLWVVEHQYGSNLRNSPEASPDGTSKEDMTRQLRAYNGLNKFRFGIAVTSIC